MELLIRCMLYFDIFKVTYYDVNLKIINTCQGNICLIKNNAWCMNLLQKYVEVQICSHTQLETTPLHFE